MEKMNLYFHGSTLPAGTDSKELRKPTLERPFFVADNPNAAMDYAIEKEIGGNVSSSVFILKSKVPLDKISFDFKDPGCLSRLRVRLPVFTQFVKDYLNTDKYRQYDDHGARKSFFDAMDFLTNGLLDIAFLSKWSRSKPVIPVSEFLHHSNGRVILDVFEDLGLLIIKNNEVFFDPGTMKDMTRFFEDHSSIEMRRLIKSVPYRQIHQMGFDVVMDEDTTLMEHVGHEYAVFDLNVFSNGYSKSVSLKKIEDLINQIN